MDGVMLGRLARDDPFFFACIDSQARAVHQLLMVTRTACEHSAAALLAALSSVQVFGDADRFAGMSPLEARLHVLEEYAEYCLEEQLDGPETSREMLLIPTNNVFLNRPEKDAFATLLRSTPVHSRPKRFGDELLSAVERMRKLSGSTANLSKLRRLGRSSSGVARSK